MVMTKQQYKEAVRKLTQEWLDSELARCKEKGLSPEGVDIYIIPEITLDGEVVRCHTVRADAKIHVSV